MIYDHAPYLTHNCQCQMSMPLSISLVTTPPLLNILEWTHRAHCCFQADPNGTAAFGISKNAGTVRMYTLKHFSISSLFAFLPPSPPNLSLKPSLPPSPHHYSNSTHSSYSIHTSPPNLPLKPYPHLPHHSQYSQFLILIFREGVVV